MTTQDASRRGAGRGMSLRQARTIEYSIIALCIVALVCIFQPFSQTVYGIGAGLVVLAGLAFNLVPQCQPGRPIGAVIKVGIIVLVVLAVVTALAVALAFGYAAYLQK